MKHQKNAKTAFKTMAACALAAGMSLAVWSGAGGVSMSADAAGKVTVKPYIEYLFDTSDTLYDNTGTSAKDETKDYTLQKLGNAASTDMCYGGELNLEDNGMLYLQGENNPFANGALTDFTFTMQVKTEYSSWYSSPVSWDSFSGNPDDDNEEPYGNHRYTRVTAAAGNTDGDWMKITDSRVQNISAPHWESYAKGNTLYTGDRDQADSGFVTLVVSVDADKCMTVQSYKGVEKQETVKYNLADTDWRLYEPNDTDKIFTLGGAWDSRGDHLSFKIRGRIDNVKIYDFAMTEEQIASYTLRDLNLIVDGVEIDSNILGGTVTVDNETSSVGEEVMLTVTPDEGAELTAVTVDGEVIKPDQNGEYKTVMKEGGIFVSATFLRSLPVEVGNVKNGTVVPDKTEAKVGEQVTFTVTPNEGYGIKKVSVNGLSITPVNGVYAAEMTDDGMIVAATFSKYIAVTVSSEVKNGSITPSKTSCFEGERITFEITPNSGYEIEKVLVNGEEIEADYGTYAVIAEGDVTANAVFRKTGGGCNSALVLGTVLPFSLIGLSALVITVICVKRRRGEK